MNGGLGSRDLHRPCLEVVFDVLAVGADFVSMSSAIPRLLLRRKVFVHVITPNFQSHYVSSTEWNLRDRGNVLEALLRETDNSVRDILAETVRLVAQIDFPDDWPDLVPTIVAQLQTGEVLR